MPEAFYHAPAIGAIRLNLPELPPLLHLQAHVPGLTPTTAGPSILELSYDAQQDAIMLDAHNELRFGGAWSTTRTEDIPHLLYALCRRRWLEHGYAVIHAVALKAPNGQLLLLAGPSGVGKTTLSEFLCAQFGYQHISGNKTVLHFRGEQAFIVAGTLVSSCRQANGTRRYEPLEVISSPLPISSIILPRLNDGVAQCQQLTELSALHTLLPLCLDSVNADILAAGEVLLDGAVSHQVKQTLVDAVRGYLQQLPVYQASGSLTFLAEQVREYA
jgi:energy-coupling factor transporter ATP-binding protein EcfA2